MSRWAFAVVVTLAGQAWARIPTPTPTLTTIPTVTPTVTAPPNCTVTWIPVADADAVACFDGNEPHTTFCQLRMAGNLENSVDDLGYATVHDRGEQMARFAVPAQTTALTLRLADVWQVANMDGSFSVGCDWVDPALWRADASLFSGAVVGAAGQKPLGEMELGAVDLPISLTGATGALRCGLIPEVEPTHDTINPNRNWVAFTDLQVLATTCPASGTVPAATPAPVRLCVQTTSVQVADCSGRPQQLTGGQTRCECP